MESVARLPTVCDAKEGGFGLVYLEALACGTPVIASTRDGSREAVADGDFGVLVDPHAPEAITEAILSAQDAPSPAAVRDRFGPAAYRSRIERLIADIREQSASMASALAP